MTQVPETLKKEIREMIAEISGRDVEEIKPEISFEELGVDSIKAIEITVAIEKRYKIRVKDEQVAEITTVSKAIEVVKEALEKRNNG